jgi:hypothetical protein
MKTGILVNLDVLRVNLTNGIEKPAFTVGSKRFTGFTVKYGYRFKPVTIKTAVVKRVIDPAGYRSTTVTGEPVIVTVASLLHK